MISWGECQEVRFPFTQNTLLVSVVVKSKTTIPQTLKFCIACFLFRTENSVPEVLAS